MLQEVARSETVKYQDEPAEVYQFAGFRLDVRERALARLDTGDNNVALPDKAFGTLMVLLRNAGRLVGKDELLNSVWAGANVDENNLNKSVHAIRRALGESSGDQRFIETVKKHGFRFVADVKKIVPPPNSSTLSESPREPDISPVRDFPHLLPRTEPHTAKRNSSIYLAAAVALVVLSVPGVLVNRYAGRGTAGGSSSLAVLPLRSLDAGDNYLGLGVADAIIRRMSQTGTLTVRPTSAVRRYQAAETDGLSAGRELGVDTVLEGTVQRSGDRLRVSVNLLRVSDGRSLWADNLDMAASDAFAIQDKVAAQVAKNLQLRLDTAQKEQLTSGYAPNAIAYEYYLKGVYSFDQRWYNIESRPQMEATIALFKKAVDADPNYALAHAQLAYAYAFTAVYVDPTEQSWADHAREEIDRADALDPQLPETHVARHHLLLSAQGGYQIEAAIRELQQAQRVNPNIGHDDLAFDYGHLGLEDMFEREAERAMEIDPTGAFLKSTTAIIYLNIKRYDKWLAFRQKYFDGRPGTDYLIGVGRLDEAQTMNDQVLAKSPDDPFARLQKATLLALKGNFTAAEEEIPFALGKYPHKTRGYHHVAYDIACIYALEGKSSDALEWLKTSAATGFPNYPLFERDPYLDRIRQDPQFVQFMADLKSKYESVKQEFAH